jgi:hypothetical protein
MVKAYHVVQTETEILIKIAHFEFLWVSPMGALVPNICAPSFHLLFYTTTTFPRTLLYLISKCTYIDTLLTQPKKKTALFVLWQNTSKNESIDPVQQVQGGKPVLLTQNSNMCDNGK